jgi:hypothetical protein
MDLLPSRRKPAAIAVASAPRLGPTASQIAQEAALAALLGGNVFGRVAMHPALESVSDKQERGKVLNRAWRRYGTVNSAALLALVAGWTSARRDQRGPLWTRSGRRRLILAKDIAVGAVVATGLASAAGGVGFAQQAKDGAVPMDSGSSPAPETPDRAAKLKHVVNVLGALNLAAEVALLAVNARLERGGRVRLH